MGDGSDSTSEVQAVRKLLSDLNRDIVADTLTFHRRRRLLSQLLADCATIKADCATIKAALHPLAARGEDTEKPA